MSHLAVTIAAERLGISYFRVRKCDQVVSMFMIHGYTSVSQGSGPRSQVEGEHQWHIFNRKDVGSQGTNRIGSLRRTHPSNVSSSVVDGFVQRNPGFEITFARRYRWQTDNWEDQEAFMQSMVRLYRRIMGGQTPQISGWRMPEGSGGMYTSPLFRIVN
jgi:hypothetical protein